MDSKPRRRTPIKTWKMGTALVFAFVSACANAGEPTPAASVSTQQANTQIREPIERLTHRSAGAPQKASDGTTELVDLRGGFQQVTMIKQNADGTFSMICTDSTEQAVRFLTSDAPATVEDR